MLARTLAVLFLIPNFAAYGSLNEPREAVRARIVDQLNQQFNCKILVFNSAEQATYAREISLPECRPSSGGNYVKASKLLQELAEVSVPVDAQALREQARSFNDVGIEAMTLDEIRTKLFLTGVIQVRDGEVIVDHIGHPFQSADFNSTRWLEAYVTSVRRMSRYLVSDPQHPLDGCEEPICDPAIFHLAQAVTARPPLDSIYYADQTAPVAPNPYALSYFSQRYAGDRQVRRALGLNDDQSWLWRVDNYASHITASGDLVFTELFLPESPISVSISDWKGRKEFPYVVPFFMLFQEASDVLDIIRSVGPNDVAASIREIRFEPAVDSGSMLSLGKIPGGLYVLHIRILNPPGDESVNSRRTLLHSLLPPFLKTAVLMAQQ